MNRTPLWKGEELARVSGGKWIGRPTAVNGLTYLPNRIRPGNLFVAMNYENIDHHKNIPQAENLGAVAALVSRVPEIQTDIPLLLTNNMRNSLMKLGSYARDRASGKFVGITGRAGKTFTKDTLAYVLSSQGTTYKTQGNDND